MNYKIEIDKRAIKFIEKQPKEQRKRILSAIYKLPQIVEIFTSENNQHYTQKRLSGLG